MLEQTVGKYIYDDGFELVIFQKFKTTHMLLAVNIFLISFCVPYARMKDFKSWFKEKIQLEETPSLAEFREREIWWCSIGINLGDEQDGKNELFERPILIVKKFNSKIAWGLPLTSKKKIGPYYHELIHNEEISNVLLSQLRLISVKRLRRFIRKISPHQFLLIQEKIVGILLQTKPPN